MATRLSDVTDEEVQFLIKSSKGREIIGILEKRAWTLSLISLVISVLITNTKNTYQTFSSILIWRLPKQRSRQPSMALTASFNNILAQVAK